MLRHDSSRRGVVLLVVLTLLTLFAVVGISFVMVANSTAQAALMHRQAESALRADVDPELLFSYFLGQLVYDVPDDERGVYSALRGQSLARNMYGGNTGNGANLVAFNGTGRLREPAGPFAGGPKDHSLFNYTSHGADGILRDPERLGTRAQLTDPLGPFTGGFNAGYTYPDLNSPFLAAVRASDGAVLLPSFHRPWAGTQPDVSSEFFDRESNERTAHWERGATPPPWFKYKTLRPLPALNPGFPEPENGGGDVKNLIGGPGTYRRGTGAATEYWNNDSHWIDLDFPIMTAPDGRRYKPLFAPLITDLDNRLNVNVHGNVVGRNGQHRSNQGWGPWEVNLGKVLTRESDRLVRGVPMNPPSPLWDGRHGPDRQPSGRGPVNEALATVRSHFYAQVDFDGRNRLGGVTPAWELPGPAVPGGVRAWYPTFGAGYGNGSQAERTNHPALFDVFAPVRKEAGNFDRTYPLSNMEALLRYGDTGSLALTSDLFRLAPTSFREPKARGLITTHSFDLDQPGIPPWLANPGVVGYRMAATDDMDHLATPHGPSLRFRRLRERGRLPHDGRLDRGEFGGADWRSLLSSMGRVNLNRPLPPYPHLGSGTTPPFGPPLTRNASGQVVFDLSFHFDEPAGPIFTQFLLAQTARQKLAEELYQRLLLVTGVSPRVEETLRVRRWLAQLAANIVDYVDEDDINTPFHFASTTDSGLDIDPVRQPSPNGEIHWPLHWVFGTELPRVVVNEASAQIGRKVEDPYKREDDLVRVFVELHNTFPRDLPPSVFQDNLAVPLRMRSGGTSYSPYRLLIRTKRAEVLTTGEVRLASVSPGPENDNVLGNPAVMRLFTDDEDFASLPVEISGAQMTTGHAIPPHGIDSLTRPQGFLLVGPPPRVPQGHDPRFEARHPFGDASVPAPTPRVQSLRLQYEPEWPEQNPETPDERTLGITVLLRRLANPYLPFNGNPSAPNYNPFLTVDYMEEIPLTPVLVDPGVIASTGKLQPYASHRETLVSGTVANPHSFGRENTALPDHQFDWLTHLDRPLTSPLELLSVSGCQPYQLTQRFVIPNEMGGLLKLKHQHRVPWLDEGLSGGGSHRLYRLFDFIETGSQAAGIAVGGRLPGRINLNTIWDPEILQALADPQTSNHFNEADVNELFTRLVYDERGGPSNRFRRTEGQIPGADDRPFWGLGMGNFPIGDPQMRGPGGIDNTLLRLRHGLPPTVGHPHLDAELLTKIFNHLTTRSNVFAVWLTVGFFEVTDESTRPVKLGAELGKTENRHVRHRMFAILDRTNLSIATNVTTLTDAIAPEVPGHPIAFEPLSVPISALRGTTELAATGPSLAWEITAGSVLVVDVGPNQEVVRVQDVQENPRTITAAFTRPHEASAPISLANMPGAPPIFVKPLRIEVTAPAVYRVTVAVDPDASGRGTLAGEYDGIPWKLRPATRLVPGTKILIDAGPNQELVEVQGPFTVDRLTRSGTFAIAVTRAHPNDFAITNTILGNPGPQPRFQARDALFGAVVRYFSVIQ